VFFTYTTVEEEARLDNQKKFHARHYDKFEACNDRVARNSTGHLAPMRSDAQKFASAAKSLCEKKKSAGSTSNHPINGLSNEVRLEGEQGQSRARAITPKKLK
jgi:hypothetical protein